MVKQESHIKTEATTDHETAISAMISKYCKGGSLTNASVNYDYLFYKFF